MITTITAIAAGPVVSAISSGPSVSTLSGVPSVSGFSQGGSVASVDNRTGAAQVGGLHALSGPLTLKTASVSGSGAVVLPISQANTINLILTGNASSMAFDQWPAPGISERVTVYVRQDSVGGRVISGWPTAIKWTGGIPVLSTTPNAIDCLVFDSLDGGATIFGNLVGQSYQ